MFSGVSISHDMTREEREQTKALVDKAKEQTQMLAARDKAASKNWSYRVRRGATYRDGEDPSTAIITQKNVRMKSKRRKCTNEKQEKEMYV